MNAGGKTAGGAAAAAALVVAAAAGHDEQQRVEVERRAQAVRDARASVAAVESSAAVDAELWRSAERALIDAIRAERCGRAGCYHGGHEHSLDDASGYGPGDEGAQFRCMAGAYPRDGVMVRPCDCPDMVRLSEQPAVL